MNCKHGIFLIMGCLAFLLVLPCQTEEPVKEAVSVINVEVPVRVFSGDRSVPGLGKDDFQVYENGKPQAINGFYVFHKKIGSPDGGPSSLQPPAGRYFVLIFRTYDCNEELEKGIQYLFQNIFRPEDQVFVMANNRTLMIERLEAEPGAQDKILELVRSESHLAHNQMLGFLRQTEQNVDMTKLKLRLKRQDQPGPDYIDGFLQTYLKSWQDFKLRFLSLELDKFYYFSRHLEHVKKEKWVLNFYQLEQFPDIAIDSEIERFLREYIRSLQESNNPTLIAQGRSIEKLLRTVEMEMKVSKDFPSEEVSKLFYKVNATFHSFFMRAFFDGGSQEVKFRDVASDIENSLKALTEATGGTLTTSNEIDAALAVVSEKTDDYYVLTYEPANAKKVGKIKVTVKEKKYKVLYDNNIRADYIGEYLKKRESENPAVKISGLSFENRMLSFVIGDFLQAKVKGEAAGMLAVRIRVKNDREQTFFDQSKNLQSSKKTVSLSLSFAFLAEGKYDIIIDVLDQVSGKTCTGVIQPLVR